MHWELGINGFDWLGTDDSLRTQARLALEIGYTYVFADWDVWHPDMLERAHGIFAEEGLTIFSTHGVTGITEWEFDIDAAAQRMSEQIRRAAALGIGNITYHTMVMETERDTPARVVVKRRKFTDRFHTLFRQLCPLAEELGVSLNVENIEGEFDSAFATAPEVISMVDPVGSPAMGVCLDAGHANMSSQSVPDMIRALGPRIRETHFHDNYGHADSHLLPGVGTIHWVNVIHALADINFAGPIDFEWFPAGPPEDRPLHFPDGIRAVYYNWRTFERVASDMRKEE
jgi:sugar phosphate isomerase/epimerase